MAYSFPTNGDIPVGMFEIWLDGKEVPESFYNLIEEVVYESHDTGSDLATIFVRDPGRSLIDDDRLVKGKKVKLFGGWKTDMELWLDGYVSLIDLEFPETGEPNLAITCMDESYLLDRIEMKYSYKNVRFSQAANLIAMRYGLKVNGKQTTKVHEQISQANETDMKLLIRLAEEEDLVVKVKNGEITWKPWDEIEASQDTLTWREYPYNLKSFKPRIVVADRKEGVTKSDVNTDTKNIDSAVADKNTNGNPLGTNSTVSEWWEYDGKTGLWKKVRE